MRNRIRGERRERSEGLSENVTAKADPPINWTNSYSRQGHSSMFVPWRDKYLQGTCFEMIGARPSINYLFCLSYVLHACWLQKFGPSRNEGCALNEWTQSAWSAEWNHLKSSEVSPQPFFPVSLLVILWSFPGSPTPVTGLHREEKTHVWRGGSWGQTPLWIPINTHVRKGTHSFQKKTIKIKFAIWIFQ